VAPAARLPGNPGSSAAGVSMRPMLQLRTRTPAARTLAAQKVTRCAPYSTKSGCQGNTRKSPVPLFTHSNGAELTHLGRSLVSTGLPTEAQL
jgi:hypothetical protein